MSSFFTFLVYLAVFILVFMLVLYSREMVYGSLDYYIISLVLAFNASLLIIIILGKLSIRIFEKKEDIHSTAMSLNGFTIVVFILQGIVSLPGLIFYFLT